MSNQTVKNGNTWDYAFAGGVATLLTLIAAFCTHFTVEYVRNPLVVLAFLSLAVVGTAVLFARAGRKSGLRASSGSARLPLDNATIAAAEVNHYIESTSNASLTQAEPVERQLVAAGRELQRLHEILAHAIDQLVHHFERIAASVQAQRQLVDGSHPDRDVDRVSALGRTLDEDIHGALTALQFQDLSAQLIQHVQDRLEAARDELARPGTGARIPDYGAVAANESHVHRVGPVAQTTVSAGSVDLF